MALIECPECEKPISHQAPLCPHCGFPAGGDPSRLEVNFPALQRVKVADIGCGAALTLGLGVVFRVLLGILLLTIIFPGLLTLLATSAR